MTSGFFMPLHLPFSLIGTGTISKTSQTSFAMNRMEPSSCWIVTISLEWQLKGTTDMGVDLFMTNLLLKGFGEIRLFRFQTKKASCTRLQDWLNRKPASQKAPVHNPPGDSHGQKKRRTTTKEDCAVGTFSMMRRNMHFWATGFQKTDMINLEKFEITNDIETMMEFRL